MKSLDKIILSAVNNGDLEDLKFSLLNGADINAKDKEAKQEHHSNKHCTQKKSDLICMTR